MGEEDFGGNVKKKLDKRKLTKKMDVLFSKIVRDQGVCDKCGGHDNLQCAHVISRKYLQTRWDLENALCLCVKCHLYWAHKEPHEFVRWFDDKFGGKLYDELEKRSKKIASVDYEYEYERLKDIEGKL